LKILFYLDNWKIEEIKEKLEEKFKDEFNEEVKEKQKIKEENNLPKTEIRMQA